MIDQPQPEHRMADFKSNERAVQALPAAELAEFRRRLAQFDAAVWDSQVEHDAASGKLDEFAAEALADYRAEPHREL
jgi:hypothetical protein